MNLAAFRQFKLPNHEQSFTLKDSILYALGIGFGVRPTDPVHLQFVYEKNLHSVPSACVVLAHPGMWVKAPELQVNWLKLVHAEQSFEISKPLPAEGRVRGEYSIIAIEDRGAERGAYLHLLKKLFAAGTDELIATVSSLYLL